MNAEVVQRAPVYTHPRLEVGNGVCTSGHPESAKAAIRIMRQGGNAFDALVASAFTTFVVEPESCGLGGYGHFSAYVAKTREFLSIDAYCRAPLKAHARMFEIDLSRPASYYGHPLTKGDISLVGWLAIAVPGAVAGLCDLHAMLGRMPLDKVMEPAIEAAENGVSVTFKHQLEIAQAMDDIKRYPHTAAALLVDGKLPSMQGREGEGDRLDTAALARLLKKIAKRGKKAFQEGAIARRIGQFITGNGGILSAEDLAAYKPRVLREQPCQYRGYDYISCFDQVAYETLNILSHYHLRKYGADSFEYRHLTAEALALAFVDSMTHYGDPDFEASPVNGLTHHAFAKRRQRLIRLSKALPRPLSAGDPWPFESHHLSPQRVVDLPTTAQRAGTSQVAVADDEGNLASACVSIGSSYGSLIYVPDAGIFMNNAMQNFDPRPEHPSHIEPGKMPIFAAPAIVAARNGEGRFAASGSGGYRIEPGVLQTMMNYIDHRMRVQRAVDHPRVHSQGGPTFVDSRITRGILDRMQRIGHDLRVLREQPGANGFGRISAVSRNPRTKALSAGAGPAWDTGVAGY